MLKNKKEYLKKVEKKWKDYWKKKNLYAFTYNPQKPIFVVDTPPPYVSANHLHAGHIMSYTQAEFIVRYKRMKGFNVLYPMGFDDNGLPTERFVEKEYNVNKSNISRSKFISLCLKNTKKGSKTYKKLWQDLGISVDWTKTYNTISPLATKISQWSLIDLYKKRLLYRAKSPILWCSSCRTALAQADLETKKESTNLNYINFGKIKGQELIVATTRPELLAACVALYVNPKDKRYSKLIGESVRIPLFNHTVQIKQSKEVNIEYGTGLVMVSTWGDHEDLKKWRLDNLKSRSLLSKKGLINKLGGKYKGLSVLEARKEIIIDLKNKHFLKKQQKIQHTVQIHERCGTQIEFILSKQWFIKITDKKDKWIQLGNKINWYPKDKQKIYNHWVNSLKWDWCISRQRFYGVPLPIWYCTDCNEPIFASKDELPVIPSEQNPSIEKCPNCGSKRFKPETDVMDTWTTSSCTPFLIKELVSKTINKTKLFPVSLRPNAFEIISTWDFYSIVKSYYHFKSIPFKNIMISGHGLDKSGKKFSKRLGNYIPSEKLLKKYTADSIRYWAAGAKLGQNLRFSKMEIKNGEKTSIKLINIARFIKMFKKVNTIKNLQYEHADVWILMELNRTIKQITELFEKYSYSQARNILNRFFWSKFSDYYIEFIKYRLRGNNIKSQQTAYTLLKKMFLKIIKMYAPIMPFITEELYQQLYKDETTSFSIHLSAWPKIEKYEGNIDVSDFNSVLKVVDEVRKYKTDLKLSLGTKLTEYQFKNSFNKKKYLQFLKNVLRIEKII